MIVKSNMNAPMVWLYYLSVAAMAIDPFRSMLIRMIRRLLNVTFCLSSDAKITAPLSSTPQYCIWSVHRFVFSQRTSEISADPLSLRWQFLMCISLISELAWNMVMMVARFPLISLQLPPCLKYVPSIPRGVDMIGGRVVGITKDVVDVGRVISRRNQRVIIIFILFFLEIAGICINNDDPGRHLTGKVTKQYQTFPSGENMYACWTGVSLEGTTTAHDKKAQRHSS